MMSRLLAFIPLLPLLTGCDGQPQQLSSSYVLINDRNHEAIYRVNVPIGWEKKAPLPEEDLRDTRTPLIEFFIKEGEHLARIVVHNFPSDNIESRIPPRAQTERWIKQFDASNPHLMHLQPQSYSGYSGLLLEAEGAVEKSAVHLLGWALSLAPSHYRMLSRRYFGEEKERQMRGDVTIKATGAPEIVFGHRDEIMAFARSFELVEEIPLER